jgi:hypothetical protein
MLACYRPFQRWLFATLSTGVLLAGVSVQAAVPAPTPTVAAARHTAPPAAAAGRTTNVPVEFDIPPGFSLTHFPRIRVVDVKGQIIELRPVYITQKPPFGRGQRALSTGRYRKGTYFVRFEVEFKNPAGRVDTVVSPFTTLVVP